MSISSDLDIGLSILKQIGAPISCKRSGSYVQALAPKGLSIGKVDKVSPDRRFFSLNHPSRPLISQKRLSGTPDLMCLLKNSIIARRRRLNEYPLGSGLLAMATQNSGFSRTLHFRTFTM